MKPILFNTEMVRAILDGRKTTTRRVVRKKYSNSDLTMFTNKYGMRLIERQNDVPKPVETIGEDGVKRTRRSLTAYEECKLPYRPGDILYVRETWQKVFETEYDKDAKGHCVNIRKWISNFDDIPKICAGLSTEESCSAMMPRNKFYVYKASNIKFSDMLDTLLWKPSIFMPREAARIFLRVTDVHAERLQDISEDGALAEGAINNHGFIHSPDNEYDTVHTAREHFSEIWNSTIKKSDLPEYGWDANPWVWVIEFEKCEKPQEAQK